MGISSSLLQTAPHILSWAFSYLLIHTINYIIKAPEDPGLIGTSHALKVSKFYFPDLVLIYAIRRGSAHSLPAALCYYNARE